MSSGCKHTVVPFFDDFFTEPKQPTEQQIKEYRLYQCDKCHRWFSFFGVRRFEFTTVRGK